MVKRDWRKARKSRPIEYKYEAGKVLDNGMKVPEHRDSLSVRADREMRRWLKSRRED